jgi:hypothetical protein
MTVDEARQESPPGPIDHSGGSNLAGARALHREYGLAFNENVNLLAGGVADAINQAAVLEYRLHGFLKDLECSN